MKDNFFFNLIQACKGEICPVCKMAQELMDRYFDNLFYDNVNDPGTRTNLRKSQGFCNQHSWQILDRSIPDALGVSIIYEDILKQFLRQIKNSKESKQGSTRSLAEMLGLSPSWIESGSGKNSEIFAPTLPCPACQSLKTSIQNVYSIIIEYLDDNELKSALENSKGFCLPHFKGALQRTNDAKKLKILIDIETEKLSKLRTELTEFIRKNDYRFRSEGFGEEGDSWRRALAFTAGEKNTSYPEAEMSD